jgi:putative glutamine amidotransferase
LSVSKPLIGITTYRQEATTGVWSGEFAMIPGEYVRGVEEAGGIGVLVHPQSLNEEEARRIVSSLDGLMLCGRRDIEPSRYGAKALVTTESPDTLRDHTEDMLLGAAIELGVPVLGICRGAQMLNVHRGGTLHQHVPDLVGDTRYQKGGGEYTMMSISISPGTVLANIYGGAHEVGPAAIYHHQAIDQPGDGLRVSASSPDGLVEAIELADHPFCVAVQWHPERTLEDLRLFVALIDAASTYRKKTL